MRNAGDVKYRVLPFERIESGVIAKGPFRAHLSQVHVALPARSPHSPELPDRPSCIRPVPPDRAARKPENRNSSISGGTGRIPARHVARIGADRHRHINLPIPCSSRARCGNAPRHAFASASAFRWCARRTPASGSSPRLRLPVSGFLVITIGQVMYRPPSCGQHCKIGKSNSEKPSVRTTSWQSPLRTVFGKNDPISASFGSIFTFSRIPCGDCISRNEEMRAATSSSESTSSARFIRRSLPSRFVTTGIFDPFGRLEQQRRAARSSPRGP